MAAASSIVWMYLVQAWSWQPPPMSLACKRGSVSQICCGAGMSRSNVIWHCRSNPAQNSLLVFEEAWYHLQMQLVTGTLLREYLVLAHGFAPRQRTEIAAYIRWNEDAVSSGTFGTLGVSHESGDGRCKDAGEAAPNLDSTVYLTSRCFE